MYKVTIKSLITEEVIVDANSYEDAINKYYDGEYLTSESSTVEVDRDVIDTDANKIIEVKE